MKTIYLDYNATTPVDPEVLEEMLPFLRENFGNPSSAHIYGVEAKKGIHNARERIANFINCEPDEIIFTSGGSESNNHSIKGFAFANCNKGDHLITSKIEHPAVLEVFAYLETKGFKTTYIAVDEYGLIDLDELKHSITSKTILISVMHANNEIGTIEPIKKISNIAYSKGVVFHTDAAQSLGKIDVNVKDLGIDLLSIAGHKLYAPKGVGVLFAKRGIKIEKQIHGANHEFARRAGTENVPYIVGLGKACEIAKRDFSKNVENMISTRNRLHDGLKKSIQGIELNGHPEKRLPNTLSISFQGINSNTLLSEIREIAASSGAACHSDREEASYVLKAMGLALKRGFSTVRFSTGKQTTFSEVDDAIKIIGNATNRMVGSRVESVPTVATKKPEKSTPLLKGAVSEISGETYKLTRYTQGLGCACKIRPKVLEEILNKLHPPFDKNILVGTETKDDAAVYRLNDEEALVQTVDFFTPIVDDPFSFGEISVANALSDIYAMGGKPLFGLNIVGFPAKRISIEVLGKILEGASNKAKEAGISIIGGHTIENDEPIYGLTVSGIINPKRIFTNSKAKPSDVLILTKPIGTGIITTALKMGLADKNDEKRVIKIMSSLNRFASEAMIESKANSCTDVTGFGLLGHLLEMAKGSEVDMTLFLDEIPVIEKTRCYAEMGAIPGGTFANRDFVDKSIVWCKETDEVSKLILSDAQTSGGLLISIPKKNRSKIISLLKSGGIQTQAVIGTVESKGRGIISIIKRSTLL